MSQQVDVCMKNSLTTPDYAVFAAILVVSAGIGTVYWYVDRKKSSTTEFLMAGRNMGSFPVSLSLLASFMSAIALLGTPAEVYIYGTQYWMIWIGYCLTMLLASHVFVPIFFNLQLTSVFEYLEMRFSKNLRTAGSVIYIVQMIFYMGMVLYSPSLALNAVTGFNVWIAVFTVGVVCTLYTSLGGMKAVMWTDVFQMTMMFAGLIAILVKGSMDHGGFSNIWRYMQEGERIEFFNFDPNPLTRHTVWSLVFGGMFTWLAIYGVNQAQVQRALCTPNLKVAQRAMWVNAPGLVALLTICCLCGMVCYAEYRHCDPVMSERISAYDQLLPQYVMDRLTYPGLPGLFVACLFSGSLSTISSGLNSLAAVTLQDLIRGIWFKDISEQRATLVSKLLGFIFGTLMILMAYISSHLGGILQAALGLFGMIGGPVLGVFSLGIIYPWANNKGASIGLATSLVLTLWVGIGAQVYKPHFYKPPISIQGCINIGNCSMTDGMTSAPTEDPTVTLATTTIQNIAQIPGYFGLYELSYMWYSTFAVVVVHVVGLTVSFLTGPNNPRDVRADLICPIFDVFCCCLPARWRRRLQCGVVREKEKEDSPCNYDDNSNKLGNGVKQLGADNLGYTTTDTAIVGLASPLDAAPSYSAANLITLQNGSSASLGCPDYQSACQLPLAHDGEDHAFRVVTRV